MVQSMFLPGPEPGEQRKKDGYGSRLQQNDGLPYGGELQSRCRLQTRGVRFREGEGGRRRYWCVGKRGVYPSLYRRRGGAILLPSPMWDSTPKGGSAPAKGGGGPHPWRQAGRPPPPLMGHMGPFILFPIF